MAPRGVSPGLRPFLPSDTPTLAALFRASVEELAAEDYSDEQREAWASSADDEEAFAAKLSGELTIVALVGGEIAGFASLKDNTLFDMLYVRPDLAGQGVATTLADAIEKLAGARGTKKLTVEASDAARDFFARRGYIPQSRNTVTVGGEWLGNTTMTKDLAAPPASGPH